MELAAAEFDIAGQIGRDLQTALQGSIDADKAIERVQAALNQIPFPLFAKGRDFEYVACSSAFAKTLNISVRGVLGRTDTELFGSGVTRVLRPAEEKILAGGRMVVQEVRLGLEGRSTLWKVILSPIMGGNDGVVGIIGAMVNMSNAEVEPPSPKRTAAFQALWSASRDAILVLNATARSIIDVSPSVSALTGYDVHELVGKDPEEILLAEPHTTGDEVGFRSVLVHGGAPVDLKLTKKDGGRINAQGWCSEVFDSNGHVQVLLMLRGESAVEFRFESPTLSVLRA